MELSLCKVSARLCSGKSKILHGNSSRPYTWTDTGSFDKSVDELPGEHVRVGKVTCKRGKVGKLE